MNRKIVAKELVLAAREIAGKKEVPPEFKEQWKNKDKDGDGKTNEPKPDFLKKKDKKAFDTQMIADLQGSKSQLEKIIQSKLGYKPKFKAPVEKGGYLIFKESGLESDVGVMGLTIDRLDLEVSFKLKGLSDGSFWGTVHLDWDHKQGGSNGSTLGTIWFKDDGKFVFQKR